MVKLRPFLVVTGSVRVEGGDHHEFERNSHRHSAGAEQITSTQKRRVHPDRRAANVVSTGFMRRLDRMRALKTPLGNLVDPIQLPQLNTLLRDASDAVAAFNAAHAGCKLTNCMVWEQLQGNRLIAVSRWIEQRIAAGDTTIESALRSAAAA